MNTPKTVAAIDELVIKGISVAEQIYLSAKDDAQAIRQLETQVQELREALELAEKKDEEIHAFDDLECFVDDLDTHGDYIDEYQRRAKQRAILEKTK